MAETEDGKMAFINNFNTSSVPSASSNDEDARKIFVGGLSWGTTEEDIKEYFVRFGPILDCVLKVDQVTGRSRGFGFVLFEEANTVETVLAQTTHLLHGRTITPRKARKGREPILKVFVGGVDPALPERSIWDHFGAYGKVVDLDLPYDRNKGCRRAFCFVTFETEEAVAAVCNDEKQKLGDKYVDVKKATPKPARTEGFGFPRGGAYGADQGGYGQRAGYGAGYASGYNMGNGSGYGTYSNYGDNSGAYGNNRYGNSSYGNSSYSNNRYGNTSYGNNNYGNNRYGNTNYGNSGNSYNGGMNSYGSRGGSRNGSARGGYNSSYSRGYSSGGGTGGYTQSTGEWGRQASNPSYGGYYNNNYESYD